MQYPDWSVGWGEVGTCWTYLCLPTLPTAGELPSPKAANLRNASSTPFRLSTPGVHACSRVAQQGPWVGAGRASGCTHHTPPSYCRQFELRNSTASVVSLVRPIPQRCPGLVGRLMSLPGFPLRMPAGFVGHKPHIQPAPCLVPPRPAPSCPAQPSPWPHLATQAGPRGTAAAGSGHARAHAAAPVALTLRSSRGAAVCCRPLAALASEGAAPGVRACIRGAGSRGGEMVCVQEGEGRAQP